MGDRIAYYKNLRLGDFLRGPETLALEFDRMQFVPSVWSNRKAPIERGANAAYNVSCDGGMVIGYYDSNETTRSFHTRKLALLTSLATVCGFGSGNIYTQAGVFAVIEDEATDATTAYAGVVGATLRVNDSAIFAVSDVVYVGGAGGGEVLTIELITPATHTLTFTTTPVYAHVAGDPVAHILWYLPNAYCTEAPQIEGSEPGTATAAKSLRFGFSSVSDPVGDA